MNPFAERVRAIIVPYLEGRQSREAAATDLAPVLRDLRRTVKDAGSPQTLDELLVDRPEMGLFDWPRDALRDLSTEDFQRAVQLIALAVRKLSDPEEGAA